LWPGLSIGTNRLLHLSEGVVSLSEVFHLEAFIQLNVVVLEILGDGGGVLAEGCTSLLREKSTQALIGHS
jgi:hypothetical protein